MQSIQWHTFGVHSNQTKTLVHFFPSAGSLTAPYPAQCKLTAFGEAIGLKSVTLDGGRVSQPDGICIDDVFPALESEKSAAVGIIIEVSTSQPRLDISPSSCVVEFVTDGFSARFHPHREKSLNEKDGLDIAIPLGLAIRDKYTKTSLFLLNISESEQQPALALLKQDKRGELIQTSLESRPLPPYSLRELTLGDPDFTEAFSVDQPYGVQQYIPIVNDGERNSQLVYYLVYRDASTGCPVSVCAL
ncbi:MAG: hypothetical protein GYA55_10480 [SAR324 cluster bacterium]|uniref:Uncharacterized protein n=1 Tax=SAR324 cluster bacterium TaxID=2024889 RepID=A0A7X9FSW5_9DELT|nr:hypothetical protein [SAR324 cluster bacterium]